MEVEVVDVEVEVEWKGLPFRCERMFRASFLIFLAEVTHMVTLQHRGELGRLIQSLDVLFQE